MHKRLIALLGAMVDPSVPPRQQVRSVLAFGAGHMGNLAPIAGLLPSLGTNVTPEEVGTAAMELVETP
jgi:hypothetical protein